MAEGGDDGKRRCVLDVVGAQGLQSYLKGALGAARAEVVTLIIKEDSAGLYLKLAPTGI